jgi:RHO protein GDP dissociation inhibitor
MVLPTLQELHGHMKGFVQRATFLKSGFVYLASETSSISSSLFELLDAGDESLQRYKESLGLGAGGKSISDPNDPRKCIILSLTMNSDGRPPVTIDLATPGSEKTLKDHPFKIKEGVKFTMSAKFKVQHQILSGLHYVQVVKRKGIRVSKDQEMLVWLLWNLTIPALHIDNLNRVAMLQTLRILNST